MGGGTVLTWEISPSLPSALSFTNGVISGKPFANQTTVTYTVYANNSGGSGSATFDLTINEPTPNIDYNPDNYTLSNNTAIRIDPILQANPPSAVAAITYSGTAAPNACMIQMGDLIFYQGTDPTHGKELWAFNHTLPVSVSNPHMIKDIYSGANNGISGDCEDMLVVNNTLFFRGNDGSNGVELWKSDGTSSGTVMVKDLNSGSGSSNPSDFTTANDKLFFTTATSSYQFRRWVSDGTNVGTYDVGYWSSNFNAIFYPEIEYNGSIYGQGWDGHRVLFSLNETTYERVADLGGGHNNPRALTIYDGWLYFLTYETASGTGCLYRTNGTEAGTSMFVCGTPQHHPMGANGVNEFEMQVFNDELYFIRDAGHGDELWKTDGTQSGTVMVKDIFPGPSSGFCSHPLSSCLGGSRLYATENYLLFDVDSDGDGQLELWKTDGTSGGTSMLKELFLPGANEIYYHQVDEIIYFRASQHGSYQDSELWSTDGTPAGTVRVEDIWEGPSGSAPRDIIDVDGTLYFIAYNGSSYSLFNVNNAGNGIIGAPTTWSISPSTLPSGLTFNNGVISGTPTVLQLTPIMYTITASNANGSSSTTINLTIIDAAPGTFAYNPVDMVLTLNQAMTPNTVSPGGGAVTSWEISPDLPAGLNFESSNGTIWGTPTILQIDPVMYTIWANNSGGSLAVNVNITINDEAPDIEYNPDWFVVDKGVWLPGGQLNPPLSAIPTNSGGGIPGGYIHTSSMSNPPGEYNSIAIDSSGFRHVAYYSGQIGGGQYYNLMYATDTSGSWVRYTVDNSVNVGQYTSIALDSNDKVHISYFDDTNTDLKYATNAGGAWATVSVDTSSVGKYTSIAVDSNDAVHISYYDTSFRDLKYATCSAVCSQASSWNNLTIDNTGIVGHTSSIAIDSSDTIHISYRASQLGNIKYATCSSSCSTLSSWTTTTIDNSGEATDPSIVVGSNDDIHIAYRTYNYASSTHNLIHTTCSISCSSAASWTPTVVTSATGSYGYISIAVDTNDGVHISYGSQTPFAGSWSLDYATCSSSCSSTSSWTNITVDNPPYSARHTSIAVDSNDRVHIVYYQSGAGHGLRHITLDASSNVYGYTISPDLPAGLKLDALTGEISGTALEISANTTYTITARNSGGFDTTTVTIEVVDQLPTVAYSPDDLQLTNNTVSVDLPLTPTLTGFGAITSWELNNTSLPSGILFGSNNGTFYGTPTELWPTTAYKVWANNTGGSSVAYLNITVVDEVPTLSYSPDNLTLTKGLASSDLPLAPSLTGSGAITSWEISPDLPNGLTFGMSNGTIWGTPTSLMTLKAFTIWANNSGGSSLATVNITVNDEVPDISYNPDWFVLTNNTAMSPTAIPTNSGGAIPSGIIDSTSIFGNSVGSLVSMTIDSDGFKHVAYYEGTGVRTLKYATDASGSWVTTDLTSGGNFHNRISIVIDSSGALHIAFSTGFTNLGSSNNLRYATCDSSCTSASSWTITTIESGPLGYNAEIAVDSNDTLHIAYGNLTSTNTYSLRYATCSSSCTSASSWTKLHIDQSANVGYKSSIAVDENDGIHISYNDFTNQKLKYAVCTSTCTSASSWSNTSIDQVGYGYSGKSSIATDSDGVIHISYTNEISEDLKYATCSSTCMSASSWSNISLDTDGNTGVGSSITIDSNKGIHISYYDIDNKLLKYAACSSSCTSLSSWTNTSIQSFLYLSASGAIAADSSGNVQIVYQYVSGTYFSSPSEVKIVALDSSSNILGYSISPDLPTGLSLNAFTGEISGTPTALSTNTTYTITARNTGGTSTTTITIEVLDQLPVLSYSPDDLTLTKNQPSIDLPLAPSLTGSGAITSWEISPDLPNGLNFGASNGTIWGIATVLQTSPVAYTVWANNSGGSTSATINITINDQPPDIFYSPDELNLTKGLSSSDLPLSPTNSGGYTQTTSLCNNAPRLIVVADDQNRGIFCVQTTFTASLPMAQSQSLVI